ncbi:methyl-accepting chemotaxis protein [Chitinibacter tainanensis]|uniref:methyl-accepting chemotaxis protein n=1 Tax=Chitinibacter tainanensis TaxID=230667 RepID=UPI0023525AB7|nr:methyl-accepting chemotaxis protein [Chitinibacter tainanensis]
MLSRLSTRNKLFMLSGTLLLLMTGQILFTLYQLSFNRSKVEELLQDRYPKIEQQQLITANTLAIGMLLREAIIDNEGREIEQGLSRIGELRQSSTSALQYLETHTESAESKAVLSEINAARAPLAQHYEALFSLIRANQDAEAMQYLRTQYDPAYQLFQQKVDAMLASQKSKMNAAGQATTDSIDQLFWLMLISGGIAAALGLAASLLIAHAITRPIAQALSEAERIAAGDLRAGPAQNIDGDDEPARLLQALHTMRGNLQTMAQQIQRHAQAVSGAAHLLASSSQQVAVSAQQQSASTTGAAATLEELTVSIHLVADSASEASQQAQNAGETAQLGGKFVVKASKQMSAVGSDVSQSASQMSALEQDVSEIGKMATIIREVADQTNLLALNAAIEAARAGETGRGFAVVADEVRKLAERTTHSAHEISEMITRIQNGSATVNQWMNESVHSVDEAALSADSAALAMEEIEGNAGAVVAAVNQISHSLNEQKLAGQDLASRMEQVAQMAEENGQTVQQLASTAQELSRLATELNTTVGQFRLH